MDMIVYLNKIGKNVRPSIKRKHPKCPQHQARKYKKQKCPRALNPFPLECAAPYYLQSYSPILLIVKNIFHKACLNNTLHPSRKT